jgi:hypothetical protein
MAPRIFRMDPMPFSCSIPCAAGANFPLIVIRSHSITNTSTSGTKMCAKAYVGDNPIEGNLQHLISFINLLRCRLGEYAYNPIVGNLKHLISFINVHPFPLGEYY